MKISYTNLDGSTTIVDHREFYSWKQYHLDTIRQKAKELILEYAPEFKQRNAALGLLSDTEANEIRNHIQSIRNISNQKEAQIESITWDGDPATHSTACDAIEAINWD